MSSSWSSTGVDPWHEPPTEVPSAEQRSSWPVSRRVRAGDRTLSVSSPRPEVVQRFEDLLGAMPAATEPTTTGRGAVAVEVIVDVAPGFGSGDWYELWIDDLHELSSRHLWRCEDRVLARLNRWVLDAEPEHLHLHAGLVSRGDERLLVVGRSGSGKSTLVTHLARGGWTYHTDEMVGVDLTTGAVAAHRRPATLKRGSWPFFPTLPTIRDATSHQAREQAHLPPPELGPTAPPEEDPPTAIAFVSNHAGAPTIGPLDAADAAVLLVEETLDLERASDRGMLRLLDIATSSRRCRLQVGDLEQTARLLDGWLDTHDTLPHIGPVAITPDLADSHQPPVPAAPRLRDTTDGWVLGDGGVLYDRASGLVVRLDQMASAVCQLLDGHHSVDDIALTVAGERGTPEQHVIDDIRDFLERLAASDLLDPPRSR